MFDNFDDVQLKKVSEFTIDSVMKIINDKIALEAERRCCADNKIVCYLNGNFQPLYVADMTPATTSKERTTFNPLCVCCGDGH